ncbi:MAG: hypothetical protein KatS3mg057_0411 [Herpetosiphonaceae bacterium]|nr:MAG: hypothetical protein KatS3mg057_0411 [Herpetosiphonaceae bacterium]
MPPFKVHAPYEPTGDQPKAIAQLVEGLQRGYKHQTLLGATGTGKSLGYADPVFIIEEVDGSSAARIVPIGELIDGLMEQDAVGLRYIHDTEILDTADLPAHYYTQSFNPKTGKVEIACISAFTRHAAPEGMYHLQTACGREATLTGDHNLWVLRDGQLQLIETADARPTDYLPLPEVLFGETEPEQLDALAALPVSRGYAHVQEAVLSEAHGKSALVLEPHGLRTQSTLSRVERRGAETCGKPSPPFWPQLSLDALRDLLRTYCDDNGTVDGAGAVMVGAASKELASDLTYAFLRFGMWAQIKSVWKHTSSADHNGEQHYTVTISGQTDLRQFHKEIGFSAGDKQAVLEKLLQSTEDSHIDCVPISGLQLHWLKQQLQLAGLDHCIQGTDSTPKRTTLRALLERLRAWADQSGGDERWWTTWHQLYALCHLRWTPITSVERIAYDRPFVYDLSVPGNETFLAGVGGLFVHNTYVMAKIVEQIQRPTLVLAHNKTLAAQLYAEFKEFFPENAVAYFVSYYDQYTPEAYVPSKDLYIEKEASINEEIDRLRHEATQALLTRRDVLIVASVSAIYGLGSPADYGQVAIPLKRGEVRNRDKLLRQLIDLQFERNDIDFHRGTFRVRGDTVEVFPANAETALRIEFWGDEIDRIVEVDPLTGEILVEKQSIDIYPAKHFITTQEKLQLAIRDIEAELEEQVKRLEAAGRELEAARLKQRTMYDLEMLAEMGYCSGIENYSRHLDRREGGQTPWTLLDYYPDDFLIFIDESHMTIPQLRGMFRGDRSRKETLVEYGFRLPSALDNRPLHFEEFERHIHQVVYVSATPGPYELEHSEQVVEQIIRPTGLLDPVVHVRSTRGQIDDLLGEIRARVAKGQRALVTTLTKRMAEDLADYLKEMGIRTHYLHADVDTIERVAILRDLRLGIYDVVVGINLLREGLDLPEVSLVAILDADKEGYLRSESALIQTIGRAARHIEGTVIMYADSKTRSMEAAIRETERRRAIQEAYNREHGIVPQGIIKEVRDLTDRLRQVAEEQAPYAVETGGAMEIPKDELLRLIKDLEKQMKEAARNLEFEKAALLRDQIIELRRTLALEDETALIESVSHSRPRAARASSAGR